MKIKSWFEKYESRVYRYKSAIVEVDEARKIIASFKDAVAGCKVYLYGAGTVGRNFVRLFSQLGIHIYGIYDKNIKESKITNFIIKDITEIKKVQDENVLIIVSVHRDHFDEIKANLMCLGIADKQVMNGHDIHLLLQSSYCLLLADNPQSKINLSDCWECTLLDNQCSSLRYYLMRLNKYKRNSEISTDKIRMIGVVLGNICSLKCKNCCECIPYFDAKKRMFVDAQQILDDISKLSSACEFLSILEFVGGEPFLHPMLKYILEKVLDMKKIGIVHIFTNGTVVPGEELLKALRNERVMVYISNYQYALSENLRENRAKTLEKLKSSGIAYFEGKKEDWLDYRSFDRFSYSQSELERNFADCFLNECNRLYRGTLYTCPHQYAGVNLELVKPVDGVIDIHDFTTNELVKKLEEFRALKSIDACMNCKLPYNAEVAISGEQI